MLFLTLILGALSACDHSNFKCCSSYTKQDDFAYVMHVQTWPGSFCSDNCCILPTNNEFFEEGFSIHGYWPQYGASTYPSCCSQDFTDTQVEKMLLADTELTKDVSNYWPSMKKCRFAMYEWSKHGSCAANVYTGENGPLDYIRATINIRKQVNIWEKLKENGVVADGSTKYDREWLRDIIEKVYGARGFFSCSGASVSELRMCTKVTSANKANPEFFDCPSDLVSQGGCSASVYFKKFPTITTKGPCTY
ncbi:ribonuclease 1 precursor, putative [Entamoeba invadens IP1]|uniref:ribonuclease 1 precursor, putative n=1 Tax=Entamoeba invadens IP1 TaxID=370355 RepID=UPI0002C3FAB1|nr:ribonuclease 1 precursor, putative [Entamoeba invadens IP1]ELP90535.1 ribonuclease 1 precursor, putative [Entamoeba invadens IP1]|eukprot:XP_004257306.1 ribonuclease 1 precursor, putative [Entamoeba invadens IP1]